MYALVIVSNPIPQMADFNENVINQSFELSSAFFFVLWFIYGL